MVKSFWKFLFPFLALVLFTGCSSTELIDSPRTAYVSETGEARTPDVLWSSRGLKRKFGYLGTVKTRAWSYNGALERLIEGGKELRADAITDIHYETIGFMTQMQCFAIKYQ